MPPSPAPSSATLRTAMIDSQLRPTGVNDLRVIEAFMPVPREAFLPQADHARAYLDAPIALAPGRATMEPILFGNLAMRAELQPSDRVLLIGAAPGYEAAVIGRLVAHVTAVECDPALAAAARAALRTEASANVEVVEGPLADGWPAGAPYDVLFLNGAAEYLPPALVDQLLEGGRFAGAMIGLDGVARASAGRKGAGVIGLSAFMEAGGTTLPGFDRPRGFTF